MARLFYKNKRMEKLIKIVLIYIVGLAAQNSVEDIHWILGFRNPKLTLFLFKFRWDRTLNEFIIFYIIN